MRPPGGLPWDQFATYLLLPLLLLICAITVTLIVTQRRRGVVLCVLIGVSALALTSACVAAGVIDVGNGETVVAQSVFEPPATRALPQAADGASDLPVFDVVLGEWDIVASAGVVPPGPLLIRFTNAGTFPHAVRIRSEDAGPRIEFRAAPVPPGGSGTLIVDLPEGRYALDCPIEDGHGEHDALGMEIPLEVRHGVALPTSAPEEPIVAEDPDRTATVAIEAFTFSPAEMRVQVGDQVTWTNRDSAAHTATGESWGTENLGQDDVESITFPRPGRYAYLCAIHPAMTGVVVVEP